MKKTKADPKDLPKSYIIWDRCNHCGYRFKFTNEAKLDMQDFRDHKSKCLPTVVVQ